MIPLRFTVWLIALCAACRLAGPAWGYDLVVTDPVYGRVNATALDQPRMWAVVTDPMAGDAIIIGYDPVLDEIGPVFIKAFVDTGASSFAISQLHASAAVAEEYGTASLDLQSADYIGSFTDIGVAGAETGDVTRPLGMRVLSGGGMPNYVDYTVLDGYEDYGDFNLWVRQEIGVGEYHELLGADPINLIGMPVIRQRRMLMDMSLIMGPDPFSWEGELATYLLAGADPEPTSHLTVVLELQDFIAETPPPGEVLPSHADNPMVKALTLTHTGGSVTGDWLLDTGAGSSFASFASAKACGLIPAQYATLEDFMADYTGRTAEIGGVGGTLIVPILEIDRISVPTREGVTLVWEHVDLLVADIAGLDGVFGMNLLIPAVTVDPEDPFGSLFDISPGIFNSVVIDTVDGANPVMRLAAPAAAGTVLEWGAGHFTAAERATPGVAGLLDDADGDGRTNLEEYAAGSDPKAHDGPLATGGMVDIAGQKHLSLTFTRRTGLPDATCEAELSTDLQTWTRDPAQVVLVSSSTTDDLETLTYRSAQSLAAAPRLFMRVATEAGE